MDRPGIFLQEHIGLLNSVEILELVVTLLEGSFITMRDYCSCMPLDLSRAPLGYAGTHSQI